MRKSLVFLARRDTPYQGSRFLRAAQLCQIVNEHAPELNAETTTAADEVSDAVVILNKSFLAAASPAQVRQLHARGNAVLADFVDFRLRGALCRVVDGFLASSYAQERLLRERYPDKPAFRVLHHADPRIEVGCANGAAPRLGYFGNLANGRHIRRLAHAGLCDSFFAGGPEDTEWMSGLAHYGVHYAIRKRKPFDGLKPFTKGAVAARCGAVILVDREEETVASLGKDYPFLLASTSYEDVVEAIGRIGDSFDGPDWRAAQAAMLDFREQSSQGRIAASVAQAFAAFR